jgi:serine protease AprX
MNSELSTCPGFSEDKDVGRAITWRAPLLAAVTAAMALSTGVSASASELATDSTPLAAEQHKPDHGAGVDTRWGDDTTKQSVKALESGVWKPTKDLGSLYSIAGRVGAHDAWRQGVTGKGVTVAVIDTGIATVEGARRCRKVTTGRTSPSRARPSGTRYLDGYGHGTHMAGIIAGDDDQLKVDMKQADRRRFAGVAPEPACST